jgi:excisionase family DNA binding protein
MAVAQIMTTNEIAEYLKLHPITIIKYAREGKIPATRIGRVWRFDKEAIDQWNALAQNNSERDKDILRGILKKSSR